MITYFNGTLAYLDYCESKIHIQRKKNNNKHPYSSVHVTARPVPATQ